MPNSRHIEIRSESVQDILEAVPNWMIRWGNTLLLTLIIILLFISWFVKYPDIISTQVVLTTQNPPEKLFANASGQFDVILVNDNDSIKENQVLAVISNTALYQDVLLLKSVMDTLKVNRNNFNFPINELPLLILGDMNSSFATFENNYKAYQAHKELNPFENERIANQSALREAKMRLKSLYSQKDIARQKLELNRNDIARQKELFDDKLISLEDYERQKITHLQAEESYLNMETSISQARESIVNLEKTLTNSSIGNTQKQVELLRQALQSFYQLKKALKDWERQYLLKSSINGQVSSLKIWDKNQVVKSGELIYTIIPSDNKAYLGKITAPAQNSGKIKKGQKVQIKLIKYPADEYGELNASVSSISLVPNDDGNYLIDVALPMDLKTTYDRTITFSHEMKGMADIVTEDLRLIERFFYQLRDVFN